MKKSYLRHRNDKRTISWSALTQNLSTKLYYQYMLINTLWPNDTIWRHTSGLPLAQLNCNGLLPYSTKLLLKPMSSMTVRITYRKTSDISRTLVGNKIVDNSDVVGAAPVGAAPTTSSFSTQHLASMDWAKTTARGYKKHLSFGIWCELY